MSKLWFVGDPAVEFCDCSTRSVTCLVRFTPVMFSVCLARLYCGGAALYFLFHDTMHIIRSDV